MKQNLILPGIKTTQLAEETGIHIGDGSMTLSRKNNKLQCYYVCSFNSIEDKDYSEYFKQMMFELYHLTPSYVRIQKNTLMINYCYQQLVQFKIDLGLPIQSKENVSIPAWVLQDTDFIVSCVRGIFDTDGSIKFQTKHKKFHYYPVLSLSSQSRCLIEQIHGIFKDFNINNCMYFGERKRNDTVCSTGYVQISGKYNLMKYTEIFGFSNPKNNEKISIWKRYGFYPPRTSPYDRKRILKGEISPYSLYNADDGI